MDQSMRVLLINSNLKDDILAAPPIGLCYVASAAEAAGHEVRVLDLCFKRRLRTELEKAIIGFSPQVIGVSLRNLDNANMVRPDFLPPVGAQDCSADPGINRRSLGAGRLWEPVLIPEGFWNFCKVITLSYPRGKRAFVALLGSPKPG